MTDTDERTYLRALLTGDAVLLAPTPEDATYRLGLMALLRGDEPTAEQAAELERRRTPEGAYPVPYELDPTAWDAAFASRAEGVQ